MEREGYALTGNVFVHADGREYLPLYEAKLFHQYDHRFATFDGASKEDLKAGNAREMAAAEKGDPDAVVVPRYWVPAEEVAAKLDSSGEALGSLGHSDTRTLGHSDDRRPSTGSANWPLASGIQTVRQGDGRQDGDPRRDTADRAGRNGFAHEATGGFLLAFRDIARATDERTVIMNLVPSTGIGNTAAVLQVLR